MLNMMLPHKMLFFNLLLFIKIFTTSANFETLEPVKSFVTAEDQTKAVEELIQRFLGNQSNQIDVTVVLSSEDPEFVSVRIKFSICWSCHQVQILCLHCVFSLRKH